MNLAHLLESAPKSDEIAMGIEHQHVTVVYDFGDSTRTGTTSLDAWSLR